MNEKMKLVQDDRIKAILNMLSKYLAKEFSFREKLSNKGDEIDEIIDSLNLLAERKELQVKHAEDYQHRIEQVMEGLLKYTLFDFSKQVEVSDNGDEIDAIAIGLNTLVEELQAANALKNLQLETIKENTEQIETILNNAPSSVIVINEAREIVKWNKKSELIFGWSSEEVLNRQLEQIIMPATATNKNQNTIDRFFYHPEDTLSNKTIELTAIGKSKQEFPIELSVSAVKSKGKYLFIVFISDISERKQSEDKIKRANQHLENSVKELEAFTYSVSHDLRAPLRAIHGYMNIIWNNHSSGLDEKAKMMMHAVMANSKKMGQLIDDLLSLSRLGRTELQKKKVDMNKIVRSVLDELGNEKKQKIIVHPLKEAFADYNLIMQVYTNLISNAVKYSSLTENPIIEIGSTEDNGEVIYYVKDNGSGFDMQFYNKLFGVFQRLHDTSEFEGNGVGLSIVKQIILRHDGRVWATSEVGKGATFNFTLKKLT